MVQLPYGLPTLIEYPWNAEVRYRSAAAIPTPRSNAPLKLSAACPPAGCSLRTWQVPGLGRAPAPLSWRLRRCRRWEK
eukprot:scaffold42657_cov58-Phaeocystis_antarctica.AAC.1